MNVYDIAINEIREYEDNPRLNDAAVPQVAESIKRFGFKVPLVIDKDYVIVAGHTRYKAALSLGLKTVPCLIASDLTPEQVAEFRLVDNRTGDFAEWDYKKLTAELEKVPDLLADFDFESLSRELAEAENDGGVLNEINEDKFDTAEQYENTIEVVTKPGDLWILGSHLLLCADSTDKASYERLLGSDKATMVFADPPYGMHKESEGVVNDNLSDTKLLEFNRKWINLAFEFLDENGSWYCWGIDEPLFDIYSHILKPRIDRHDITFQNYITWAKHSAFGVNSELMRSFPRETEKCLFVMNGDQKLNNNKEFFNDKYEGIRAYLAEQAESVGLNNKKLLEICGVQMYSHWFTKSQFTVIPERHYAKLQTAFSDRGAFGLSYAQLRALYSDGNGDAKKPLRAYFDNTHNASSDEIMTDVWRFSTTPQKEREDTGGHATPKPLALCSIALKSSSRVGDIVLDPFGGSGSTLIACEQLQRKARMIEVDPRWCDVIIKRWEKLTGGEAILKN